MPEGTRVGKRRALWCKTSSLPVRTSRNRAALSQGMNPRSFLRCKYYIFLRNSTYCHSQRQMTMCVVTRMLKFDFWRVQQLHKKFIKLNAVLYIITRSTLDRTVIGYIPCEYSGVRHKGTRSFPITGPPCLLTDLKKVLWWDMPYE